MNAVRPSLVSSEASTSANSSVGQLLQRVVVLVGRGQDHLTARPDRQRGVLADLVGQRHRLVERRAGFDQAADQPELVGPLAGIGSPVRISSIAAAWPMARGSRNRPPAPAIRLRFTSARPNEAAGRGDDQIGGEHDLAPARGGQPVDGDDDRLAALAVDEAGEAAARRVQLRGVAGVDLLQVGAGTEHRAWPGRRCWPAGRRPTPPGRPPCGRSPPPCPRRHRR